MTGYAFHPEALVDLAEIWDYISPENPEAANRIVAEILSIHPHLTIHNFFVGRRNIRVFCEENFGRYEPTTESGGSARGNFGYANHQSRSEIFRHVTTNRAVWRVDPLGAAAARLRDAAMNDNLKALCR